MQNSDLLSQVRQFRSNNLKRVTTRVTANDGQQYVETLQDSGNYSLKKSGFSSGYVIDNSTDITVSHILPGLILGKFCV